MDPDGKRTSTRAVLLAAAGQNCWPPAGSYMAATGQDLMAADTRVRPPMIDSPLDPPRIPGSGCQPNRVSSKPALWLVLGGIGLLFKFDDAIDEPGFGWRASIRPIALVEVVGFVADLASFPLWIEIPAQALAGLASIISAWSAGTERPTPASTLANLYLIGFSISAVGWAIRRVLNDWADLDHGLLLREFLLPLWLTPVALMGVYAFAIFCAYETAFVQMTFAARGRSLVRQRFVVVLRTAGRVGRLRALRRAGSWRFAHTSGFRDAWNEVGRILHPGTE